MPISSVVISPELIRKTIEENNYIPENAKEYITTEEFKAQYGLEKLKSFKKGKELLEFLFGTKEQNAISLTYSLEFKREFHSFWGKANGTATTKILNFSTGSWKRLSNSIEESEAVEIAYDIRNILISLLEQITKDTDAVEILNMLENEKINLSGQLWLKKYLTILYPDKFMTMLNDDWIDKIFTPIGLERKKDWFENSKIFSEEARKYNIEAPTFYHIVHKCIIDSTEETPVKNTIRTNDEHTKKYVDKLKKSSNIIFRGAPGTGKSYLAKQIAADIISGGKHTDYKRLTPEEKKQVEFVQFHPSYDYSDFVEGLRPIKEASVIGFELKDGSFKAFVNRARENFENSRKTQSDIEKELSIDEKISDFLETSLGNQEFETLHGNKFTISSYDDQQIKIYVPNNEISHTLTIKIDDIKKLLASEQEFKTIREVRRFFNKKHATQEHSYIYILYKNILESSYAFVQAPTVEIKEKPFVFIIDEINRGEISKIFGELFYSIEPSKRGRDGEIATQYVNLHDDYEEKFYIPQNVYIIGTMNDIDRSVDSFDFAMRRRFKFIEITAKESQQMLDKGITNEVLREEAKTRMNRLNEAIDKVPELNSNYHIGASYFMNIKVETDFKELWIDSLKPLLQEYIVGTYTEKATMTEFENAYFGKKAEEQAVKNANDGVEDESDETNG